MSCKNQSHISARVSDDTSSFARVSNDTSSPTHVSDDISGPIRLWHVSPIRLLHVLLTHLQTPIDRSLPKTFRKDQDSKDQDSKVKKFCWNQALKPPTTSRTSTPKSENIRNRIIQTICLDPKICGNQAQRSENINKSQISEAQRIQTFKAPKNFHHKPSNTRTFEEESSKSSS